MCRAATWSSSISRRRALSYHVFIERARDASPLATAEVAAAIASRFGLPSDAIAQRMAQGRFRVKSNVDRATADRFAGELEKLGAVVSVVDAATGQPLARAATPAPAPAPAPAAAAPPSAAAPAAPEPSDDMETGLAAAFTGEAQTDMGLLSHGESASFTIATIDGDETQAPAPAGGAPTAVAAAAPSDDMFRPPDEGAPLDVALDVDAPPPPPPPSSSALPPGEPLIDLLADDPGDVGLPGPAAAATAAPTGNPIERVRTMLARSAAKRIAVGAMLAVLAGYIPALLVGAIRNGAYDTPRERIEQANQTYATTPVATAQDLAVIDAALDKERADQRSIMEDTQSSIALTAGVAWLLVGGGVGFFWFRKIDWDRWA